MRKQFANKQQSNQELNHVAYTQLSILCSIHIPDIFV